MNSSIIEIIIYVAYLLTIIGTILVVVTDNKNPTKTLAWVLVLIFIPALGIVLYYVFGQNNRRKRKENITYEEFGKDILSNLGIHDIQLIAGTYKEKVAEDYLSLADLLEKSDDSWVLYGSDVEIITEGKRKFEALMLDMENARHHIHMEYFYFKKDKTGKKVKEILMRKAREGVEVRFIYENIANIAVSPRFYYEMKKAGVQVIPFSKASLPWARRQLNYRDHRKIVVIDGVIGYTGGMNIGDEYAGTWRDTHLRILGQGVYALQSSFLYSFYCSEGKRITDYTLYFPAAKKYSENLIQIVPESPTSEWPYLLLSMIHIVNTAKKYLYIQTPYYMPTEALLQALQSAALRGVDVRIMLSHKADIFFMTPAIHSYYEESLHAGIRIYERHDCFIHAKTLVADDYISLIGSANMDLRSLELSYEINCYLYDRELALQNKDIFEEEMKLCVEVFLSEWVKRPWWKKLFESVMRLFSPLL